MGDRYEETVWEYRGHVLGTDIKPKGPSTCVSRGHSFIKVQGSDPEAQYEACEFGNTSSHDIAFRVTKTNGLVFVPNHGVLKPGENVPLKFKLPPGRKSPACAEIEVLAIRVNEADTSRKIENKWQHVPSNKISRARHTVELRAAETSKGPGRPTVAVSDRTSPTTAAGEPVVVAKKVCDQPEPRADMSGQQSPVSRGFSRARRNYEKVAVFLLAAFTVGLAYWLYSLDRRVKDIEEHCNGIFYWISPFCHQN